MLDLKFIRENPEAVRLAAQQKNVALNIDGLLAADRQLSELRRTMQLVEERRNAQAKAVRIAGPEQREKLIEEGRAIASELDALKPDLREAEQALQEHLWLVPNLPSPDAPVGASDDQNVEVSHWGTPPQFGFQPRDHVELLALNDWADLGRVTGVSGTRSYSLKNELVLLELALHRFTMDMLRAADFTLLSVPSMAREEAFYGTGHFPEAREQAYHLTEDNLFLTGTSEVVVNSLHRGELLAEADLPLRYAAISSCFRREAGSSGKDTRGLIRVHQFLKVEQFVLCKGDPSESLDWHMKLLGLSEGILRALELPYRILDVCTGDMGAGKVRQYDLEAWVPSQDRYRETHSCSMLYEWQARRTDLRYRDADGVVRYCHTLNNTGIATPRILVPLLEIHQQQDGRVRLPQALQPYMGADIIGMSKARG